MSIAKNDTIATLLVTDTTTGIRKDVDLVVYDVLDTVNASSSDNGIDFVGLRERGATGTITARGDYVVHSMNFMW